MTNTQRLLFGGLAAFLVLAITAGSSWYFAVKVTDANWVNRLNKEQTKANAKVKLLNNSIARLEAQVREAQEDRISEYLRGVEEGKNATENLIADLRSRNDGLWLEIQSTTERADSAEAAAVQSARDARRSARLTTEASEALIRIAADGDAAIRQLNLCQVEYKTVYDYNTELIELIRKMQSGS